MLMVACKATYVLLPAQAILAREQDPLNETDDHWNDDEQCSLQAASDLAPFKRRADVFLVGHAHAPRMQPVSSLVARLIVGDVDKAIEVHTARAWTQDGHLLEGPLFTRMPLRYELAGGGPGPRTRQGCALTRPRTCTDGKPSPTCNHRGFTWRSRRS
jgi:hypothetical protein